MATPLSPYSCTAEEQLPDTSVLLPDTEGCRRCNAAAKIRAISCLMLLIAHYYLVISPHLTSKFVAVISGISVHTCSDFAQLEAPELQQPLSEKHKRHSANAIMQPAPGLQHASLPARIHSGHPAQQHRTEAAAAQDTPRERSKKRKAWSEQGLQPAELLSTPGISARAKTEPAVVVNGPGAAAINAAAPVPVKTEPGSLDRKLSKKQKRKVERSMPDTGRADTKSLPKQEPSPGSAAQLPSAGQGNKVLKPSKKQRNKLDLSTPDLSGMNTAVTSTPKQEPETDSAADTTCPAGHLGSDPDKPSKKKSRLGISAPELIGMNIAVAPKQEPAFGSAAAAGMLGGKTAKLPEKKLKSSLASPGSALPAGTSGSMPVELKLEAPELLEEAPSRLEEAASVLPGYGAAVKNAGCPRIAKSRDGISDTEHRTAGHTLPNGHCQPQQHARLSDGTGLPASSSRQHKRSSKKTSHATHIQ